MTVQLIPVIKIGYNNQNVPIPGKYPFGNTLNYGINTILTVIKKQVSLTI